MVEKTAPAALAALGDMIVWAFASNRILPGARAPKAPGGSHPSVVHSAEEIADWLPTSGDAEAAAIIEGDWTAYERRYALSQNAADRVGEVLGWLRWVSEADMPAYEALKAWAQAKARPSINNDLRRRGEPMTAVARRLGISDMTLGRRRDRALRIIQARLDRVAGEAHKRALPRSMSIPVRALAGQGAGAAQIWSVSRAA